MSDVLDELRDAVFDTSPSNQAHYLMCSTPIGVVMFGSDGTMKYGDNFSEDVPPDLRDVARSALNDLLPKP